MLAEDQYLTSQGRPAQSGTFFNIFHSFIPFAFQSLFDFQGLGKIISGTSSKFCILVSKCLSFFPFYLLSNTTFDF